LKKGLNSSKSSRCLELVMESQQKQTFMASKLRAILNSR